MTFPKPSGGFEWAQAICGPVLQCGPLAELARHVFTTRGLALRGALEADGADWSLVAGALGVSTDRLARLRQRHGARVVEAVPAALPASNPEDRPEADVLIGRDPTVALVVAAADCVPLLLADPRTGSVAAVHAGWRGTAAGAAAAAVAALRHGYGVRPANLVAAIGPSIGPCCYVVGPELRPRFADHPDASAWFRRGADLRLDLWRATTDQLVRAGLDAGRIHAAGLCTACHPDCFHSYRREGDAAGRMAGAIRPLTGPGERQGG